MAQPHTGNKLAAKNWYKVFPYNVMQYSTFTTIDGHPVEKSENLNDVANDTPVMSNHTPMVSPI